MYSKEYRNVLNEAQTIEEEVNNNKHNSMQFPPEPAAGIN
jgi:hypothetical protein